MLLSSQSGRREISRSPLLFMEGRIRDGSSAGPAVYGVVLLAGNASLYSGGGNGLGVGERGIALREGGKPRWIISTPPNPWQPRIPAVWVRFGARFPPPPIDRPGFEFRKAGSVSVIGWERRGLLSRLGLGVETLGLQNSIVTWA